MTSRCASLVCFRVGAAVIGVVGSLGGSRLAAQGITTGAIRGTVRTQDGAPVDSAAVFAVNQATGLKRQTVVRGGRFRIEGLEIGGPYTLDVRRIGFTPLRLLRHYVSLGDPPELDLTLTGLAAGVDTVRVAADAPMVRGVGTAISDSMLRRLPTLNGDMYDFVRTAPQVGTRFGLSGAGASFRFDSYVIDGLTDRALQGNNAPARAIPLDAVKEYQVLLSPFDPRHGDFAGLLVNAVTKSGTNEVHGSGYAYLRNAGLARSGSFLGTSAYDRELYGFSLGGPIVRDRVHYFFASEVQRSIAPARGPYIGQPDPSTLLPPADSVTRFTSLLRNRGLDAGDGGRVMLPSPSASAFGRLDVQLPEIGSRLVLRGNYNRMDMSNFQRRDNGVLQLSSNASTNRAIRRGAAVQLFSQLSPAAFNELQTGYMYNPIVGGYGNATMPFVSVAVGKGTLTAGPGVGNQGGGSNGTSIEVGDYVTVQASAAHTIGFGAHVEFFRYNIGGVRLGFGQWTFPSLDALAAGRASSYTIGKDEGTATSPVVGAEPSAYVSDEWRLGDRMSLTLGMRADGLSFSRHPLDNPDVDAVFQRRTSDYPVFRPQWSPRLGFQWRPGGDDRTIVRGGTGVFVGRPPMAWLIAPMRFNGSGSKTLTCSGAAVPAFTPYPAPQPATCSDGTGSTNGAVTLVDRHLRMAESFRSSLAVDRRLPWNVTAGVEALYARTRSDFAFSNLNLGGPIGVDPHGRVLYGSFDASGVAQPATVPGHTFTEVVELHNQSGGDSWSVTAQVHKPWSDQLEMHASYTYSRVRDVQSITNASPLIPLDLWAGERPLSGRLDDAATGISGFEIPHRVVLSATYVARWKHGTTDVSVIYVGESGTPFTYGDSTVGRLTGDLNADGTAADDPIYIPRNARDPKEIQFAGDSAAQGAAFEKFISDTPCLNRQRGRIMARNSCRSAWVNTSNLSVRQSLPMLGRHAASVQLEVFNVLNLLKSSWGIVEARTPWILGYAARTPGVTSQPIFTFDPSVLRNPPNADSGYQLQLSLRYSF